MSLLTKTLYSKKIRVSDSSINDKNKNVEIALIISCRQSDLDCGQLSDLELSEIQSSKSLKRKNEYIHGRLTARQALSLFYNEAPAHESILRGPYGEPAFASSSLKSKFGVSITHSADIAAAVVFPIEFPFAIDLETTASKEVPHLQNNQLMIEKGVLERTQLSLEQKFHLCWTSKESLAKMIIQHSKLSMSDYKLKDIQFISEKKYLTTFEKFDQYKTMTFLEADYVFSLCMLKNIELQF